MGCDMWSWSWSLSLSWISWPSRQLNGDGRARWNTEGRLLPREQFLLGIWPSEWCHPDVVHTHLGSGMRIMLPMAKRNAEAAPAPWPTGLAFCWIPHPAHGVETAHSWDSGQTHRNLWPSYVLLPGLFAMSRRLQRWGCRDGSQGQWFCPQGQWDASIHVQVLCACAIGMLLGLLFDTDPGSMTKNEVYYSQTLLIVLCSRDTYRAVSELAPVWGFNSLHAGTWISTTRVSLTTIPNEWRSYGSFVQQSSWPPAE